MMRWVPLAILSAVTSLLIYPRTANPIAVAASVAACALALGLALQPVAKRAEREDES